MEIVNYPHPALRWKSKPLSKISNDIKSIVREMFELMYEARGVGLAANQVALPYRLFVVNLTSDPEETEEEFVFINPEIVHRKGSEEGEEGCLSLPGLYGQVRRAEHIVVEAYGLDGLPFQMKLNDLAARVVQHENDHLDGVLFFERMSTGNRQELEPKLREFEISYGRLQSSGQIAADEVLCEQLKALEPS